MQIKVMTVPTTTFHYVRQSFSDSVYHIAGDGRRPAAKALCGVKRIAQYEGDLPMWADTSVTPPANLCPKCETYP
jgi:hypothetical protein